MAENELWKSLRTICDFDGPFISRFIPSSMSMMAKVARGGRKFLIWHEFPLLSPLQITGKSLITNFEFGYPS